MSVARLLAPAAAGFSLILIAQVAQAVPVSAQTDAAAALARLRSNAAQQISYRADAISAYVQVRALDGRLLAADNPAAPALDRALEFLSVHGAVSGVTDAVAQLRHQRSSTDHAGNTHVHLEQMQNGLPVFGSRLVVHMNAQGIYGLSGQFVPGLDAAPVQPAADLTQLGRAAVAAVQKTHPAAVLSIESSRLMYYRSGVLEGHQGRNYLAYEVVVRSAVGDVRERVIADAVEGGIINRINQVHALLNREIYTPNQDVPPALTEGAVTAPADPPLMLDDASRASTRTADTPVNNLYVYAGGTYALYKNLFGREGYDDGAVAPEQQVQKSVYLINDQCPNAYWNGDSTNYCPGFDADDVVSHEWSHAYTEYTHGLIYQYQSGALNESYSDIFGETYDLVNNVEGPLGASLTEGAYYKDGGTRWLVGEDLSEAAAQLLLRDMWEPDEFPVSPIGYPYSGQVIAERYFCGTADGGGVHINSSVPNHAFAMLVDGKTYNGVTVPAIGMTKAAHIYFQAATHYQTPSTNFAQHADALEQSCADLVGVPLNDVTGAVSAEQISAADCAAVTAAMQAVEMRESPKEQCGYVPVLQPEAETPSACPSGQFEFPDFSEDWEGGALPAGWVATLNQTGDSNEGVNWTVSSELPEPHSGHAAFVANSFGGTCAPGGDISASFQLDSPEITVGDDASFLKFAHLMQSEASFDGGNLKYSINGAEFALLPASAFVHNPYSATLEEGSSTPVPDPTGLTGGGNTNPIAGQDAWSGSDQGESFSSWGASIVDLAALGAGAGDKIRFRFEFGQDGCNGNLGWFVDQLDVLHCSLTPPPGEGPVTPPTEEPPPVVETPDEFADGDGRFGGGLGWLTVLLGAAGWAVRSRVSVNKAYSLQ